MNNEPFVIEQKYDAPVERVWQAITDKDKMKQWYFDIKNFRLEEGFEFEFIGEDQDCKEFLHKCKILEVVPNQKFRHSWRYEGYAGESFVTWELFPDGNGTKVKLTHEGLETFPAEVKAFAKQNFVAGWTEITGKLLKQFVEKN